MDRLWTKCELLPKTFVHPFVPTAQCTNSGQILDANKFWMKLIVAMTHLWPTVGLSDKLLTNIGHAQTLDKVWLPFVIFHGPLMAHSRPTQGPAMAHSRPTQSPLKALAWPTLGPSTAHSRPRTGGVNWAYACSGCELGLVWAWAGPALGVKWVWTESALGLPWAWTGPDLGAN